MSDFESGFLFVVVSKYAAVGGWVALILACARSAATKSAVVLSELGNGLKNCSSPAFTSLAICCKFKFWLPTVFDSGATVEC